MTPKESKELKDFLSKLLKEVKSGTAAPAPAREKETEKEAPTRKKETDEPGKTERDTPSPKKREWRKKWPEKEGEPFPGPKPQGKTKEIQEIVKQMKLAEELSRMKTLLSESNQIRQEMAMNIEDPDYDEPHPSVRKGIEGEKETYFSNLPFFKGGSVDYTTLEKLGSEEFNQIIKDVKPFGKMSNSDFMKAFQLMSTLEMPNKAALEALAIRKVKEQFGLPDEIVNQLEVKLVREINKPDDDTDNLAKEVVDDLEFTEEELKIIKKHVEVRRIQNLLKMGAGYKSHSVFNSIKQDLDNIDPKLYPLYEKTMPNVSLFMWKIPLEDMMQSGGIQMMGLSKLKKDENNEIKAEASAVIFPILLHETAKAAIELIFADYIISLTERFGENIAAEIINQSDIFEQEIWMKRIGNTLWKYLHDVIDYVIVHEKGGNYTFVSYLLRDISMLEPDKFVKFMNDIVYDGQKSIETISKMIDEIESDLESDIPVEAKTDESKLAATAGRVKDDLIQMTGSAKDKLKIDTETSNNFENMSIEQLQVELKSAVENEQYELATEIVKLIKSRS